MTPTPRPPAGVIHLHRGIALSDSVPPRLAGRDDTHPRACHGCGIVLALLLVAPVWVALWWWWPVVRGVLGVVGDVARLVA